MKFPEKLQKRIVKKGWGKEEWIVNNDKYCGKILYFNKNSKFSMHYHLIKDETWHILEGSFILKYIDLTNAEVIETHLNEGDIYRIRPNVPHQLIVSNPGKILEISTEHTDEDNYRVFPGDSQIKNNQNLSD